MATIAQAKTRLLETIAASQPDGTYDDAGYAAVNAAIADLLPFNPTPRPIDAQGFVAGPWKSLYAAFGTRHTAGKPIQHISSLKLQSFSKFPDVPIAVQQIEQEIRVEDRFYNNVSAITTPDGSMAGTIIVWGDYDLKPEAPQRYDVKFTAVELRPPEGTSDAAFRTAYGLPEDAPLRIEMKPPRLHSDVVYCDDDMRINFGGMGGVYVLERLHTPGKSVSFA